MMIKEIAGFVNDCKNADAPADFYAELLGWEKILSGDGWAGLRSKPALTAAQRLFYGCECRFLDGYGAELQNYQSEFERE